MTVWDFSLPFFRIKGRGLDFDHFKFFVKVPHHNIKIYSNLEAKGGNMLCSGLIT